MVRLPFLAACLIYLWLQSLFVQTSHTVTQGRHLFTYNTPAIILSLGFNLIPIGAAWFLWRIKKDKIGAGIFLLFIPVFALFILPQLFLERVEITPTHIIHRREPPHTRFNVDIAFDEIISAVELHQESGNKGFLFTLKDGRVLELPSNTVLTAARDTLGAQLRQRNIPVTVKIAPRKSR